MYKKGTYVAWWSDISCRCSSAEVEGICGSLLHSDLNHILLFLFFFFKYDFLDNINMFGPSAKQKPKGFTFQMRPPDALRPHHSTVRIVCIWVCTICQIKKRKLEGGILS